MKKITEIRETLSKYGAEVLTTEELLVMLLGRTGKDKLQRLNDKQDLVVDNRPLYKRLATMSVAELEFNGFSNSEAIRINAALELGKRSVMADKTDMQSITSPEDCVGLLMPLLRYETHEKFVVIILNAKNKVLAIRQISEGSLSSAVVHPREVFQKAIMNHAAAIICAHNHPSGDPTPSKEDKDLTSTLAATGKILGIPVLDHVVVSDGLYYSFKEHSNL